MEELNEELTALHTYEQEQEKRDIAYSKVLVNAEPLIDEMNILLGQILDMGQIENYDFEDALLENIATELGL